MANISLIEKLRNALAAKDIYRLNKSGRRLADALKFHIEKEDIIVLNEAEKRLSSSQIRNISYSLNKQLIGACASAR